MAQQGALVSIRSSTKDRIYMTCDRGRLAAACARLRAGNSSLLLVTLCRVQTGGRRGRLTATAVSASSR
jgi:hypothetical protein